jgi:membrane peptidoglycan carboxypeptidase
MLGEAPVAPHPTDDRITALLDLGVQRVVATLLRDKLARWRSVGAQQAAAIVVQRGTNAVLAAVGSDNYGDTRGGAIDFTRAIRSPGSTLKPFLYAAALQRGLLHPADMLDDGPGRSGGIRNADSGQCRRARRWPIRATCRQWTCCAGWASARGSTCFIRWGCTRWTSRRTAWA